MEAITPCMEEYSKHTSHVESAYLWQPLRLRSGDERSYGANRKHLMALLGDVTLGNWLDLSADKKVRRRQANDFSH